MTDCGYKRKSGAGCIGEINAYLFERRYSLMWPTGRKQTRNVYAKTRVECEEKLKTLIVQMKARIGEVRAAAKKEPYTLG